MGILDLREREYPINACSSSRTSIERSRVGAAFHAGERLSSLAIPPKGF
jgi:hypothetical protein